LRFQIIFISFIAIFVFACQNTVNTTQVSEQALALKNNSVTKCELGEHDISGKHCDQENEGTFPVSHPVEPVEVPLEVPVEIVEAAAEQPVKDLWQRIRNQLEFEFPNNSRIRAQKNWYLKHPDYMQRVAKRV
jgi:membrane-bound lytic murein transglycosylase D